MWVIFRDFGRPKNVYWSEKLPSFFSKVYYDHSSMKLCFHKERLKVHFSKQKQNVNFSLRIHRTQQSWLPLEGKNCIINVATFVFTARQTK